MQIASKFLLFCLAVCMMFSCSSTKRPVSITAATNISALKLLGEYDIPYNLVYENTTVGGLSGIDYDAVSNNYYMVCDDRSAINPARFYTAKINLDPGGIDSVYFVAVTSMLQPDGSVYPNKLQAPSLTPDPEAMRYDPFHHQLVWSSEGERIISKKDTILEDPAINVISPDGRYLGSFEIPPLLKIKNTKKGPRQNGVLEGMTFSNDYKTLFVNVEEPLYEDGPRADTNDTRSFIRILEFDVDTKKNVKQFAYKLEPVAYPPHPSTAFKINGVPDILSIGDGQLLIIERSFSTGRLSCTIKLFIAGFHDATDIQNISSLEKNTQFKPMSKRLLLNMDDLGIFVDNIEGIAFGPTLPNGHKTLIFVADNNFSPVEKSQVFLFEVL